VTAPALPRLREPAARAVIGAVLRGHAWQARRLVPLSAVLLSGLVVHVGVAPHLAMGGTAPDALLASVVAVAVRRGPRAGAAFGFAAGLGADLFVATPLGTSALAVTLVGHVLGRSSQPASSSRTATALCSPGAPCFACRSGALHGAGRQRRAASRRAAPLRSVALTILGVGAGRLGMAVVATTLAGVPFPDAQAVVQIAATAALSAPFGLAAFAVLGRLSRPPRGRR
jgi:hypothetical protein